MQFKIHAETRRRGERKWELESISAEVVDVCVGIHRELGPGLLENVYELVLAGELERRGLRVDRQVSVNIDYCGVTHNAAFRIDLLVENSLILEIKAVESLNNAHLKQLLTYLQLTYREVGLLLNFLRATMKEGIRRVVNNYRQKQASSAPLRLRVNQSTEQS